MADERPPIPADAASDVPAIGSDGDGWYHVIFRAWGLRAPGWDSPFAREGTGDDPLYERILLAFERDTEADLPEAPPLP